MDESMKQIKIIDKFAKLAKESLDELIGCKIKYTDDNSNTIENVVIVSYEKERNYIQLFLSNGSKIKLI